jgi:hypothetical protein
MASIYKHRNGWQACANVLGERSKKNFATESAAKKWANATEVEMEKGHKPSLGGLSKVKLAGMLVKYAHQFTNSKKGAKNELDRINRYLIAAIQSEARRNVGQICPPVHEFQERCQERTRPYQSLSDRGKIAAAASGANRQRRFQAVEVAGCGDEAALPSAFQAHLEERRDKRAKTNALRAELACTLVSDISKDMLRTFMAQMHSDGLGGSTALKEMALLKHALNMAIREWNRSSFKDPLLGMKLPTPAPPRDRVLASDDLLRIERQVVTVLHAATVPRFLSGEQ